MASAKYLNNNSFTRENVESLGNLIYLVDSDEDNKLDMFCYIKCGENDSELLKQCRGVVFNGNDLILKAFPYTSEYNHKQKNEIETALDSINKWVFYESYEGTLIRLFFFNGRWFVSTHRKLNAFKSKWSSRESFGASFKAALLSEEKNNKEFRDKLPKGDNILERFQNTLDKNKQYMFLLRNTKDNRIVCSAPENPTVYHVGTFVDGKLMLDNQEPVLTVPAKLSFKKVDEILSYVDKISYENLQGVIGFNSDNKQLKIVNKKYQDLFNIRGNEPSIKYRYLQIRLDKKMVDMLNFLYPEMSPVFDEYENILYDIARYIHKSYIQRFIKKEYITVPREEFSVIRECHSWHLSNREKNRVSIEQIIKVLNTQSPTCLNHMIRRFRMEKNKNTSPAALLENKVLENKLL